MNIFYLDQDHATNASYHVDSHVIKMVVEYAQLLSNGVRSTGINAGYLPTHKNHPCTLWVCESLSNWLWLRDLCKALNEEYRYRYDKLVNHRSYDVVKELPIPDMADIGLTTFRLAMPDDAKVDDPIQSYRNCYTMHKRHLAKWKKRPVPHWYK